MLLFKPAFLYILQKREVNHQPKGHKYQGFSDEFDEQNDESLVLRNVYINIFIK